MKKFNEVSKVVYDPKSVDPFTFNYYNADEVIAGKTMKEHLKFALSWWHTICAGGLDMFGGETMSKKFACDPMAQARAKVDFAFDIMTKLGVEYYCFHDVDLAPEGETLEESVKNLEEITDYLLEKQNATGIKLLWGTANNFSDKKFMGGASTSPNADVFAIAAGKV